MSEQENKDVVLVNVSDAAVTRGGAIRPIKVELLAENVTLFLKQLNKILENAPDEVGQFRFTEFTVNAEISAKGMLVIMGTGAETQGKGGVTFKFERK